MGGDYPKPRFGSSFRASPLTLARNAPHRSNGVRILRCASRKGQAMRKVTSRAEVLADGRGFEPLVPCGTHAFQACTIDRSVTHPANNIYCAPL